jgi:hypothetical protein
LELSLHKGKNFGDVLFFGGSLVDNYCGGRDFMIEDAYDIYNEPLMGLSLHKGKN